MKYYVELRASPMHDRLWKSNGESGAGGTADV